jgi:hypothetical protein
LSEVEFLLLAKKKSPGRKVRKTDFLSGEKTKRASLTAALLVMSDGYRRRPLLVCIELRCFARNSAFS